jgi:hypothetical protein
MTLSSMFSETKHHDRELLFESGELMIAVQKFITYPIVEEIIIGFSESYTKLKEKINTHDYSPDDIITNRVNTYFK